jgi:hypothetical protein
LGWRKSIAKNCSTNFLEMRMTNFDWIITQALHNAPVDAAIQEARAACAAELEASSRDLEAKRIEVLRQEAAVFACPNSQAPDHSANEPGSGAPEPLGVRIVTLARRFRRAVRAETGFMVRHGLYRERVSSNQYESASLLGLLVLVEGGVNAAFLESAHMVSGPVAALLTSLTIALTNVAACVTGGYFVGRYLDYGAHAADADSPQFRKPRKRAKTLGIIFLCAMAFFHLTVGLIRSQETLDEIHHSVNAYLQLLGSPGAVFLILFGIVMSAISWKKGKSAFGDPYPGLDAAAQAVDDARCEAEELYELSCEDICDRHEDALTQITDTETDRADARAAYNQSCGRYLSAQRELNLLISRAEMKLKSEIALIINHYCAARGDKGQIGADAIPAELISFDQYRAEWTPLMMAAPTGDAFAEKKRSAALSRSRSLEKLNSLFRTGFGIDPSFGEER